MATYEPASVHTAAAAHYRARAAALSRANPPNDPRIVEAKTEARAQRLMAAVRKTVDSAPPLTDEQVERIADTLRRARLRQAMHVKGDEAVP